MKNPTISLFEMGYIIVSGELDDEIMISECNDIIIKFNEK